MSPSVPLCLLQTQTDARLVELARGGHERAFEALVQRYRKPLLGYCRRLLLPESRAEDALQQALVQAWLSLGAGDEVREPRAWLYRIVHNSAVSALRRSGYDYVELDESIHGAQASESDLDRRIAVRETLAGIAALPEAQREVLLRTAVQGHSHEEVALALGISDGAVRGLVYRARATLRTAVTAVTPPQIAIWAARAAEGASHPQLGEMVAGGGSAGMLGVLLKGGAVVVSAGMLATGATIVQHSGASPDAAQADQVPRLIHRQTLSAPAPAAQDRVSAALEVDASSLSAQPQGSSRRRKGSRHSGFGHSRHGGDGSSGGGSRAGEHLSGTNGGGAGSSDGGSGSSGGPGPGRTGSGEGGSGSGDTRLSSGSSPASSDGSGGSGSGQGASGAPRTGSGSGSSGGGDGATQTIPVITTPVPAPETTTSGSGQDATSTQSSGGDGSSGGSGGTGG